MMSIGLVLPGYQKGSQAASDLPVNYAIVENRSKRESIWKLMLRPVAEMWQYAAHGSHRSHSSHVSHSSHTSHYSGSSAPTKSNESENAVKGTSPAGTKTDKATLTIVSFDKNSKLLKVKRNSNEVLNFSWSDLSRVRLANGSAGTTEHLQMGKIVEVNWIERDGKKIILDVVLAP
jgi:hypothetical protein